jgi:hypothetical protein
MMRPLDVPPRTKDAGNDFVVILAVCTLPGPGATETHLTFTRNADRNTLLTSIFVSVKLVKSKMADERGNSGWTARCGLVVDPQTPLNIRLCGVANGCAHYYGSLCTFPFRYTV